MSITAQMLMECVQEARRREEKLVLLVGQPGSGKSKLLRSLGDMRGWHYMEAGQMVTEELMELLPGARAAEAPGIMSRLLAATSGEVCIIDGVQAWFTPLLRLEPLSLLRRLSRRHVIVAAWPGTFEDGCLYYEYFNGAQNYRKQYPGDSLTVMQL